MKSYTDFMNLYDNVDVERVRESVMKISVVLSVRDGSDKKTHSPISERGEWQKLYSPIRESGCE